MPNNRGTNVTGNTIVICLTSLTCVTLAALVAVFLASNSTTDALARAGIITGFVGILIPQMLMLVKQDNVSQAVHSIEATANAIDNKTDEVLNGGMDEKIHAVLDARGLGTRPKR